MYRTGPRYRGTPKKASTTTQCQRCLEYGHWTYECNKERSYKVRPTRTQQLKKPIKLYQPELPKELLSKEGLADKILKKKKKERRRRSR
ncbi:zinc knuckle-domain-containing protein [Cokeromyces recurvatus]|uniref:zinc knuckle-domain-containing protein n=1 Tax=Cokeromyces recurvatus TaxID=90255 RepID=UPI00221E3EA6|nr:zinc knuckle-domain-containing protein [Cokeromyces recurvatus]KAI7898464.1 zinc knuckle-domain-containing protein [Cokeromyces recurvatus]